MNNIRKIIAIAHPYQKLFLWVSFLILLTAILQLITPVLIKQIVDVIEAELLGNNQGIDLLYPLLMLTFAINVLGVIFTSLSNRLGDALSGRTTAYLIKIFYEHILRLPQSYFDTTLSGKIANQLTRGIASIGDFMGAATNFIFPSIMQTVLTIGLLMYYSIPIGLLSLAIFPLYILISHYSTKKWGEFEVEKNALEDRYKSRIVEVIQNMKLVKTANTQSMEFEKVSEYGDKFIGFYDKQSSMYHWLNFYRNAVLEIILIIIILITFRNTFVRVFTLGEMVLIIQLLNQLRRPLFAMSFILERIQRADTGAKEYFEILDLQRTEDLKVPVKKPIFENPSISLKNVSFSYDTDKILKNISLTINPGETVALIGPSGAGKTTLVNLLLKLYEPDKGSIFLNDKQYNEFDHHEVRAHYSYVFQDNELFSSTVLENVAYGNKVARAKITKALEAAYALDFVNELPEGINTEIGEKGVRLSGGQKQRLQIARAIVSPAPILILDEATSSLDAKSENIIQDALMAITKQKTVIIIAHRFSTLQHVDRILVIDKGKIVDQGSPKELASKPGIFQDLLRYQVEGNQKLLAKYELI